MYIEAVPNRHSPPAILLRESYREGGRVKKRTLLNLSDWPADRIAGFKMLLKGGTVIPSDQQAITIIRSLPHGHVAAALGTARKIGLDQLLGPNGNRCRDLVLALVVSRLLEPGSKLAALAVALAQQDGRRRVAIGNRFDIHGNMITICFRKRKKSLSIYMATIRTCQTEELGDINRFASPKAGSSV